MATPTLASRLAALFILLVAGCQSARETRIQEKAAFFGTLDSRTQDLIRKGDVDAGFSPELVYLALGQPNRIQSGEAAEGRMETWTYRNFLYGSSAAMRLGVNNPGARYQGGSILAPNAPGGPSIASTKSNGIEPTVGGLNDTPIGTLYIDFLNGQLIHLHLDPH